MLKSESQNLVAHGFDFQYDAKAHLTVLKDDPERPATGMSADQEGNKIHAHELQILELPPGPDGKAARQVTALGPGQIDLLDKTTKKLSTHASWRDKLVSTKDGAQDLIVLSGAATFTDDEHDQTLQADTLKVWLAAEEGRPTAAPGRPAGGPPAQPNRGRRQRLRPFERPDHPARRPAGRLLPRRAGRGRCRAGPAGQAGLPVTAAAAAPARPIPGRGRQAPAGPSAPHAPSRSDRPRRPPRSRRAAAAHQPHRPLRVRLGAPQRTDNHPERTTGRRLRQVHQDPAKEDEKGVDVKGDTSK